MWYPSMEQVLAIATAQLVKGAALLSLHCVAGSPQHTVCVKDYFLPFNFPGKTIPLASLAVGTTFGIGLKDEMA